MNPSPNPDDVSTALGLLRDSISSEEERIRAEGAKAMHAGDYDTATAVIDFAKRLLAFQKKVEGLVHEWEVIIGTGPGNSRQASPCTPIPRFPVRI